MKSYYWLKIHHEALDDPKMQRLSDRLYRRTFECFMMASQYGKDGELPPLDDMAWKYNRCDPEQLESELFSLMQVGIISHAEGVYYVTNFAKRQGHVPGAERVKSFRERQHKAEYYGETEKETTSNDIVTECYTEKSRVEESIVEKSREEKITTSSSDIGLLVTAYEANIGAITAMVKDMLVDDLETYGLQLCLDAIVKAVEQNKRKWSYVRGILKNWWTDGRDNGKKPAERRTEKTVLPGGQIVEVLV